MFPGTEGEVIMRLRIEAVRLPLSLLKPIPAAIALAAVAGMTFSAPAAAQQERERELLNVMAGLRGTWQELEGLEARFDHTFEWVLAGETQVTRGRLWLAGRNRFRLEFEDRVMVSDGTTIWDHDKKQKQVLLMNADPSRGDRQPAPALPGLHRERQCLLAA